MLPQENQAAEDCPDVVTASRAKKHWRLQLPSRYSFSSLANVKADSVTAVDESVAERGRHSCVGAPFELRQLEGDRRAVVRPDNRPVLAA
jgi:hypothetical protein